MIDVGVRLYDVMWVLAVALNNTMTAVESGEINGTGCDTVPGSLVSLEQFSYRNEKMGCLIQWNLQRTNFSGVSVSGLSRCIVEQLVKFLLPILWLHVEQRLLSTTS